MVEDRNEIRNQIKGDGPDLNNSANTRVATFGTIADPARGSNLEEY